MKARYIRNRGSTCKPCLRFSPEQLSRLRHSDLYGADLPLLAEPFRLLESKAGGTFEQKELELLQRLTKKLGYYYLIFRLDGLWGNGGMQSVALDRDPAANLRILEATSEAFAFFGGLAVASLLTEFTPVAMQAADQIAAFNRRNASDDEFEPVWARLDAFDARYDAACSEFDVYQAILDEIHLYPNDWHMNDA